MVKSVQRFGERGALAWWHKENFHRGTFYIFTFRVKTLKILHWVKLMPPRFSQITRGEIAGYRQQIEEFAKRFYREGPGSVGEDLDSGEKSLIGLPGASRVFCFRVLREDGTGGASYPCLYAGPPPLPPGISKHCWCRGPGPHRLSPLFWSLVRPWRSLEAPVGVSGSIPG